MELELKKELEFYESKRAEWLKYYKNKFVLIKEEDAIDFFTTVEEAYKEGVKRYGNQPFLIKQILEEEPVEHVPAFMLGVVHANL